MVSESAALYSELPLMRYMFVKTCYLCSEWIGYLILEALLI